MANVHRVSNHAPGRLWFRDAIGSDNGSTDDKHPSYVPYVMKWRVALNYQALLKDTGQVLDSTPSEYWENIKKEAGRLQELILFTKALAITQATNAFGVAVPRKETGYP
ncbi:hypothetical protein BDV36DRAFT_230953 [Aspergillus pseudocaelatus]|uniref:Uncharacterized protein n=1 Tax=Aspergillus pseudocaelatus TaxID=1825620 RepID=A0ABQ6WYX2_9EURO|nr:hypothetical protein BDV36DRAFT_230953 [Aspergillus pseudocaelatus]